MNDTDLQAMALRLELMRETITAMAAVMPRHAAGVVADAVRASVAQRLADADMPEAVDEQLAACLAPLLTALESDADSGIRSGARPGHKMARPVRPTSRAAAKMFRGGARPTQRASRRTSAR